MLEVICHPIVQISQRIVFRAGMKSELVLAVGERSKRFKTYTSQNVGLDESDYEESEELESKNSKCDQSKTKKTHQKMATSCISFAPIPSESDSQEENWWTLLMPETDRDR